MEVPATGQTQKSKSRYVQYRFNHRSPIYYITPITFDITISPDHVVFAVMQPAPNAVIKFQQGIANLATIGLGFLKFNIWIIFICRWLYARWLYAHGTKTCLESSFSSGTKSTRSGSWHTMPPRSCCCCCFSPL